MDKQNNEYRLGLYEKSMPSHLSWKEKLITCKEAGFDYLEMSIDESDEKQARLHYSRAQRKEIIDAMWECEVPISSICLSAHRKFPFGSKDERIAKQSLSIMQNAIILASELGVRIIQLAGYDVYYEEGDAQTQLNFSKNLRKAVQMASKHGILLGFETMETPFMDTVEKAMNYVEFMNSPYLGVYPDIGNLKNASLLYLGNVNDDIRLGNAHIFAAHLKETQVGKYREIPYGQGHTNFKENIEVLHVLGVRMFVGEFWYTGSDTWFQDIVKANVFLRDILNPIFHQEA